jgi:hypothetical protein
MCTRGEERRRRGEEKEEETTRVKSNNPTHSTQWSLLLAFIISDLRDPSPSQIPGPPADPL